MQQQTCGVCAEKVIDYEMAKVVGVGVPHEHVHARVVVAVAVGPYEVLRHLACTSGGG